MREKKYFTVVHRGGERQEEHRLMSPDAFQSAQGRDLNPDFFYCLQNNLPVYEVTAEYITLCMYITSWSFKGALTKYNHMMAQHDKSGEQQIQNVLLGQDPIIQSQSYLKIN